MGFTQDKDAVGVVESNETETLRSDQAGVPVPDNFCDPPKRPCHLNILGDCRAIREVRDLIGQVSQVDVPVLIQGEAGTGKDMVATAIHQAGPRAGMPFIRFSPAGLSPAVMESELFGREKDALADTPGRRIGRIEEAHGGTLLVEELCEFSSALQVKFLRAIQNNEFERLGGSRVRRADVRFIVATRRDLEAAVAAGQVREDLYYRLSVLPILLPPLRGRREDIPLLAGHFAGQCAARWGRPSARISAEAIEMLVAYDWPGNVRELEACIEHAVLDSADGVIGPQNLPTVLRCPPGGARVPGSLAWRVEALERDMLAVALARNAGNVTAAALELGITARMARYKIVKLGIDPTLFKHHRRA